MDAIDVTAVVGACAPERRAYAQRLARGRRSALLPASRLAASPDPVIEAIALLGFARPRRGSVLEIPLHVPVAEVIGTCAEDDGVALREVVCVVDAAHLLMDLDRGDHLPRRSPDSGVAAEHVARALLTVTQIELASTIVLVRWAAIPTEELALLMALVSHLNPGARLTLERAGLAAPAPTSAMNPVQDGAGWMRVLSDDFTPHMTDRRVSAFRYEQLRPLHPGRLMRLLDEIGSGDLGRVVRSAGFCRVASRPGIVAGWEHVGTMFALTPLATDDGLGDEEVLALGQDLAVIGVDLDAPRLTAALDAVALSDAEWTDGPASWASLPDPFPAWAVASDRNE